MGWFSKSIRKSDERLAGQDTFDDCLGPGTANIGPLTTQQAPNLEAAMERGWHHHAAGTPSQASQANRSDSSESHLPPEHWSFKRQNSIGGRVDLEYGTAEEMLNEAVLAAEEKRQLEEAMAASLADQQERGPMRMEGAARTARGGAGPAGEWRGETLERGRDMSQEELDRELALRLAEDEEAVQRAAGSAPSSSLSDEEMARRLQQQIDLEEQAAAAREGHQRGSGSGRPGSGLPSAGPYGGRPAVGGLPASSMPGGPPSTPPITVPTVNVPMFKTCGGCSLPIGYGRYLSCLGRSWHPHCFTCRACRQPISEHQFSVAGNEPYHTDCHRRLFQPKCCVCKQFIPPNADGLIEYKAHTFWGEKYCPVHEDDGTAHCCGCEKLEPVDMPYIAHQDGRKLCLDCVGSIVVDTEDCRPLYSEVMAFYEDMGMAIRQKHIPLLLVERQALNEASERERRGEGPQQGSHHHPETRGLCLSEEQTIQTVRRIPAFGAGDGRALSDSFSGMGIGHETQVLRRHCEVTAILVLYGLPRLLTGSLLAHELMHAWLRLNGSFPRLPPQVEEGICQAMAQTWLKQQQPKLARGSPSTSQSHHQPAKGSGTQGGLVEKEGSVEAHLADFFLHQIEMDRSPVYGDGFRMAQAAIRQFGLSAVLEHIRLTGTFPE